MTRAYVYLLRCGDGSLYCGWTFDLQARLAAHAAGRGARYTRGRGPVELAAAWAVADRPAAQKLELAVKRRPRAGKDALVRGAPLQGAQRVAGSAARAD